MSIELASHLLNKIPSLKPHVEALGLMAGDFDQVEVGKHAMAVMGMAGDTKHIWDPNQEAEVEAARAMFNTLTSKGYRAFHVTGSNGDRGEIMSTFDPKAAKVIFVGPLQGG